MERVKIFLILMISVSTLVGCGFFWRDEMLQATPEAMFQRATQDYLRGRYRAASELFQRLADEHPLNELAELARIGVADSLFSSRQYDDAARVYREFIFFHPNSEHVPYAMYQLGMTHFIDLQSADRDQSRTIQAKNHFETLIARFPESSFSFLAGQHLKKVKRRLADREFNVGMFYFNKDNFRGAISRFETILREYPNVGLDYKVIFFLEQARRDLAVQEARRFNTKGKIQAN